MISNDSTVEETAPILGFLQTNAGVNKTSTSGRIVVYGDSNCLDNSNNAKGYYRMIVSSTRRNQCYISDDFRLFLDA